MSRRAIGAALACLAAACWATEGTSAARASPADLRTIGEISGYARTGRYDEVERLCAAFAAKWPQRVRCFEFGRTPERRPMLALVASDAGGLDPASRRRDRPVLLFQGGIHGGEIDGKDAGFKALEDLLEGRALPGALKRVTVVFVPVYNVDGHERFGRWNRPNQRGPEEMGWRTTAQNLNLNRDYTKADAPETQAMLRLLDAWDPILYADLHVTDGAQFQEEISVQIEPGYGWDVDLGRTGLALRDAVVERLEQQGFRALPFYPSFVTQDDPASGFAVDVPDPRYSTGYWATRNRFSTLVETHSWKNYARRVAATRATILAMVELAARDGARWLAESSAADARACKIGGQTVALHYSSSEATRLIDFQGYSYTREPSEISGQTWIRYDESAPQVWHVPLRYAVEPTLTAIAPANGYVVPVAYADWISRQFELHGIQFEVMKHGWPRLAVQSFLASDVKPATESFEGHTMVTVHGDWRADTRDVPAGSLFVPIAQPNARLLMSLLEPEAPDSYVSWGFFDTAFEQKEYMEDYVTEAVARDMLAKNPELKAEFERRLREDAAFAADSKARLDFFHRRHPSWDDRYDLYPVYRR
jgi:murein tripeptide amidase MpaA